jgi:hypothetical protein
LEGGEDEDGSLTETGLGLAEDIGAKDRLRDADLLDYGDEAWRTLESFRFSSNARQKRGISSARPSISSDTNGAITVK